MRAFTRIVSIAAALLISGAVLGAQRPLRQRPLQTPSDSARRQAAKQRMQSLTPQQRAELRQHMNAARGERQQLAKAVQSGQITKQQARGQMRAWQKANRPQNPPVGAGKPIGP
jgi:hypothetical protein